MRDIVERLHKCDLTLHDLIICDEAADTIEQLRKQVANSVDTHIHMRYWEGVAEQRKEECEALRKQVVLLRESLGWLIRQMPEPSLQGVYTDGYRNAKEALEATK